jgi:hypothetical protein
MQISVNLKRATPKFASAQSDFVSALLRIHMRHRQVHRDAVLSRMSLYYDAANVLSGESLQGSLKSRIYGANAGFKSKPAHVYALISECAKYDLFLSEVIDKSGILAHEPKVCALRPLGKDAAD